MYWFSRFEAMAQAYPLTDTLIQNFLITNFKGNPVQNLMVADDAVFCIDGFVQYFLAAINAGDVNQIKECCHIGERLFLLNEENVAGMLSMHLITTIFPVLEKKIQEQKQIRSLLMERLLLCFNYYLTLENNWLY